MNISWILPNSIAIAPIDVAKPNPKNIIAALRAAIIFFGFGLNVFTNIKFIYLKAENIKKDCE
ncbi:hypothetical protein APA_1843 [Pseudanabaena sp. lw0831]|nr:hypothetical protein APA_1843 [Pseudanabaena sp. lw0831]